ncbi:MAG: DUF11 domain-containing protein, partial [Gammaproteobacteria bacterium]|nr:DUF11 domain-containing protein [Gammaproteobacteria bacterium]
GFGCGGGGGAGHRESGGGGGYNGGGAGGASGNPGGGGSFVNPSATNIANTAGINAGGLRANGTAQICYDIFDADISITKTDGPSVTTYTPGEAFTYTITVSNAGPDEAGGTVVQDIIPGWAVNPEWECMVTSNGAVCPVPTGTVTPGDLNTSIDTLPANSSITFEVRGTYSPDMADYP